MKVLYKFRFANASFDADEAKNISVTLDASCKILEGLQVALMKLNEDAARWKIVSVRHFDEDFSEYVNITDDDVIEGLAKYEVELEPNNDAQQALTVGHLDVKYHTGKTTTVTLLSRNGAVSYAGVKLTDSVMQLKRYIERVEGLPPDQQRLLYGGKELDENRSLQSYGICDESSIFCVMRLRGC